MMEDKTEVKKDRIFFDIDDLFVTAQKKSQLRARKHGNPDLVITDSEADQNTVTDLFKEATDQFSNRFGAFGRLKNYEGSVIYEMTEEQTEYDYKLIKPLIDRAFAEYIMYGWFRELGELDLASVEKAFYDQTMREIKTNSTQPSFVTPKSRPYF